MGLGAVLKDLNNTRESLCSPALPLHIGLSSPTASDPALQCYLAHLTWAHLPVQEPWPFSGLSGPSDELLGKQVPRPSLWPQVSGGE